MWKFFAGIVYSCDSHEVTIFQEKVAWQTCESLFYGDEEKEYLYKIEILALTQEQIMICYTAEKGKYVRTKSYRRRGIQTF